MNVKFDPSKSNFSLPDTSAKTAAVKAPEDTFESKLKRAMDDNDDKELKKVCGEFESIFMRILYKQMKDTVAKSDLIPESNAQDMFQSLLDDKLSDESSKAGGIGLGGMLYKQMKRDMMNKYKKE